MKLQLVQYYDNGWRTGHLISIHRKYVRVLPIISAYVNKVPRLKKVDFADIKPCDDATVFTAPAKSGFKTLRYLDPLTGKRMW